MESRDWQHGMQQVVEAFDAAHPYNVGFVRFEGPDDLVAAGIARTPEQRARAMVGANDRWEHVVLVEPAGARVEGVGAVEVVVELSPVEWDWVGEDIELAGKLVFARSFTQKQREAAAKTGAAMPDGSFPIHNEQDLHNAIRLAGNAKDPAAARAHIKRRAASLGLSKMIPDTW